MYKPLIFAIIGLTIFGCASRIPEPISYQYSQQHKMQASHHWEILAADLANRINNQLILSDNIDTAVFVKETCGDEQTLCKDNETSPFNEAFRDLLITDLVNLGIPTRSQRDEDAIEIFYKVQPVRHDANRFRTLQPGVLTAISSAILVLRNAPSELLLLAGGVGADIANTNLTFSSNYEVIITTSMIQKKNYLFRSSDIYYINDRDIRHYQDSPPTTAKVRFEKPPGPAD